VPVIVPLVGGGAPAEPPPPPPPPPPTSGTITGTAVKGPVSGATVTAYRISGGAMGTTIASATTDAQGNFSLAMGSYAGPVMLQMTGGTFTDEATGANMPMRSGDAMTAVMPTMTAGSTVSGIQLTPLTSMAQAMAQNMSGGLTDANIASANTAVDHYFMVTDILHNVPMNPLTTGSGNAASQDSINYGMVLGAMSQMAMAQGMSSSSAMVTAMANDASDGVMDGRMGGNAVMMGGMNMGMPMPAASGTTGLATAMSAFAQSGQNHSGVAMTTIQALMSQLNGSNGQMMAGGSGSMVNGTMSGKVFNGVMSQGTVTAYAVGGGNRGAQIGSTTVDSQGGYTMSIGSYAGPVMLQVSNGSYMDEASGHAMTMGSSDVMTAVMASITGGAHVTGVQITPLTSMAQMRAQAMSGGMMDANINAANTAVGGYFMMTDILHTACLDPTVPGSGAAASTDQRNCGIAIAAMSQYAKEQGMSMSYSFVTDMMDDAADGMMNGMMGGTQISMGGGMMGGGMMQSNAGTTGLATSMTNFMGSAANRCGLTSADMNALIQKLAASDGKI
jgi:hypothetical protein